MKKTTVAIDIDGVISDTATQYKKFAKELGVDDFRFYTYNAPYKVKTKDGRNFGEVMFNERFDEVASVARPYPDSQRSFRNFINHPNLDVIIVTARPEKYNRRTKQWLSKWGFDGYRNLIHTKEKQNTEATVLIDDGPKYIESFLDSAKMGVLVDREYNQNITVPYRVRNLQESFNLITQHL